MFKPSIMKRLHTYAILRGQSRKLLEQSTILGKEIASLIPPFKVGDIIRVRGFYHRGKKGKVLEIDMDHNPYRMSISLAVKTQVLKANGELSKHYADFTIPIFTDGTIPTYEEEFPEPKPIRKITMKDL